MFLSIIFGQEHGSLKQKTAIFEDTRSRFALRYDQNKGGSRQIRPALSHLTVVKKCVQAALHSRPGARGKRNITYINHHAGTIQQRRPFSYLVRLFLPNDDATGTIVESPARPSISSAVFCLFRLCQKALGRQANVEYRLGNVGSSS